MLLEGNIPKDQKALLKLNEINSRIFKKTIEWLEDKVEGIYQKSEQENWLLAQRSLPG